MKKQKGFIFSSAFILAMVLLMFVSNNIFPKSYYDNGVTDQQYISITDKTIEAQKFRELYEKNPNFSVDTDRDGALAVDYRMDTENPEKYLRLRIFIDPATNKPAGKFIDCYPKMIYSGILQYIEKNSCLEQKD